MILLRSIVNFPLIAERMAPPLYVSSPYGALSPTVRPPVSVNPASVTSKVFAAPSSMLTTRDCSWASIVTPEANTVASIIIASVTRSSPSAKSSAIVPPPSVGSNVMACRPGAPLATMIASRSEKSPGE